MAQFVKVENAWVNPDEVEAILPGPNGATILTRAKVRIETALSPDAVERLFNPPPQPYDFDPNDLPF